MRIALRVAAIVLAGGDVRTCLALTPKATGKDATMFRLRRPGDASVQPVDLTRSEATWAGWVRERILACER